MTPPRILVLGLDGFDVAYASTMIDAGLLPNLKALRDRGTRFAIDDGANREVGLPWEQFATGLTAADGGRQSAVWFDRRLYDARQPGTGLAPFTANLDLPTVMLDMPGFDIRRSPRTFGVNGWGSHSPGVKGALAQRPEGLFDEIVARFGPYPADGFLYDIVWHDPALLRRVADALHSGLERRTELALWLLGKRLPDWRLAFVVESETHSAAEAFWHGAERDHPLNAEPTGALAHEAIRSVYVATDRFVGRMRAAFPDAVVVALNMHGMGRNRSDVPTMGLLPELLYRAAFGVGGWTVADASPFPMLPGEQWDAAVCGRIRGERRLAANALLRTREGFGARLAVAANAASALSGRGRTERADDEADLSWMVPLRYRLAWPAMRAFALPSYHDGRVRVNLRGRERFGLVAPADYSATLDSFEALLSECVDPATGRSAVRGFLRPAPADPRLIDDTDADLLIQWADSPMAISHPRLGTIGPLPWRRVGGHTGGDGFAWFSGGGIRDGDGGLIASSDLVPTLLDLLAVGARPRVSGRSRKAALTRAAAAVH